MYTSTLAQAGYRARRIEPAEPAQVATRADLAQAAQQRTTFLDQCAAEAFAAHWFPRDSIDDRRRSTVCGRILAAIREHGPQTAQQLAPRCNIQRDATAKVLRRLREEGQIVIVGQTHDKGHAQIYGLP